MATIMAAVCCAYGKIRCVKRCSKAQSLGPPRNNHRTKTVIVKNGHVRLFLQERNRCVLLRWLCCMCESLPGWRAFRPKEFLGSLNVWPKWGFFVRHGPHFRVTFRSAFLANILEKCKIVVFYQNSISLSPPRAKNYSLVEWTLNCSPLCLKMEVKCSTYEPVISLKSVK